MNILTIPKSLANFDDLVVLPRRDYEQLVSDSAQETVKRNPKIDRAIKLALKDVKEGRLEGPFNSVEEFMSSLRAKDPHQLRRVKK